MQLNKKRVIEVCIITVVHCVYNNYRTKLVMRSWGSLNHDALCWISRMKMKEQDKDWIHNYSLRITITVNMNEFTRTWWNNLTVRGWSLPVQPPLGFTDTRPTLGPTVRYMTAPTQQQISPFIHSFRAFMLTTSHKMGLN